MREKREIGNDRERKTPFKKKKREREKRFRGNELSRGECIDSKEGKIKQVRTRERERNNKIWKNKKPKIIDKTKTWGY